MFEKWTDRARRCMTLANARAVTTGKSAVAPADLLYGILEEGRNVACAWLANLGVDRHRVLADMGSAGTPAAPGRLPLIASLKDVIASANTSAEEYGDKYVGTQHLLVALVRRHDGDAAEPLAGYAREAIRPDFGPTLHGWLKNRHLIADAETPLSDVLAKAKQLMADGKPVGEALRDAAAASPAAEFKAKCVTSSDGTVVWVGGDGEAAPESTTQAYRLDRAAVEQSLRMATELCAHLGKMLYAIDYPEE